MDSDVESDGGESQALSLVSTAPSTSKSPATSKMLFTGTEKALLITLVQEYKHVIEDKSTGFGPTTKKERAWDAITAAFNSNSNVNKKSKNQVINWWKNTKKRAKKDLTNYTKEIRKTGGGARPKQLKPDTEQVMCMIPSQMKPLDNKHDSDGIVDFNENSGAEAEYSTIFSLEELRNEGVSVTDLDDNTAEVVTKSNTEAPKKTMEKRRTDPRSSLVEMEHAEHVLRVKILQVQLEEALVKKEMAIQEKVHRKKIQELELNKLQSEVSILDSDH